MKKLLLSAFALAVAISASAFNLTPVKNYVPIKAQKNLMALNQQMPGQFKSKTIQPGTSFRASEEDLVTVPDGVTIETDWTINGSWVYPISQTETATDAIETATEVAIDGNDVYIKGLAQYFPDAWVKGTINGTTATFPITYVGSDDYGDEYLVGYSNNAISNFTFTYDAENNAFTLNGLLIENSSSTTLSWWALYQSLTVAKGEIVKPDPVVAPEGLETLDAIFAAYAVEDIDEDNNITWEEDMTQLNLKIGADNDVIYIQGLCTYLPEAWVIASFNEDGQLVIPTGQYFGAVNGNDVYLLGYGETGIEDLVFTLDEENGYYQCDQLTILSSSATTIIWWEIYSSSIFAIIADSEEIEELYMVGTFNNWSTTEEGGRIELAFADDAFTATADFEAGDEFKLITPTADGGWQWFGGIDENQVGYFLITNQLLDQPINLVDGSNFRMSEAGNYTITITTQRGLTEPLAMTVTKNTPVGPVYPNGDVTGDNTVDIEDVNAIINIILKVKTEDDYPGAADLNNDGTIDVDDMNIVINIILTQNPN